MNNNEIKHVGVLGMRWGVRRRNDSSMASVARGNREAGVLEARKKTGLSSSGHKNVKKMSNKELDKELATLSTHHALMKGKKIDKATIRANSKKVAKSLNKIGTKRMSYIDREQRRRDVTRRLIIGTLAVIGGIKLIDIGTGIGYALLHS